MKYSRLFVQTLREAPSDAELVSHQLALRAGLIRPLAAGIFSYLPLGLRVKQKIEKILREEMTAIECAELSMPIVQPAELWQESGRWTEIGSEMLRMRDRGDREMCLAMTHEEAVADLARNILHSYRQLPMSVFQLQTKFRDEPRSRGGLIRVREFTMKDAYSFDIDEAGLDAVYQDMYRAYENIFKRSGLGESVIAVESDTGMMGGTGAHEFMYLNSAGEDTLLLCDDCGYSANRQIATFQREEIVKEEAAALEEVETPGCTTIKELADFLKIPESKTAKAVFLMATVAGEDRFVFALLRGDHELNETKLANAVEATEMRPATEEEIRAIGSEPGYGSPVGVSDDAILVVDEFVAGASNLVSGANKVDHHYLNVNCGRDFEPNLVTDLVAVSEGMPCPTCGSTQRSVRGIEVGNIFKLGTKYTEALGVSVLDEESQARPVVMGSYGIGLGRLLACIIEEHHDDNGIIWPMSVAPFQVHIVVLSGNKPKGELEAAEGLSKDLEDQGIDVLVDDRDERAGVKFNDADLIGIPIRITVGSRGLANGQVEVKMRTEEDRQDVPLGDLVAFVKKAVAGADQAE
jgi:prolyl-tRNA synthetase